MYQGLQRTSRAICRNEIFCLVTLSHVANDNGLNIMLLHVQLSFIFCLSEQYCARMLYMQSQQQTTSTPSLAQSVVRDAKETRKEENDRAKSWGERGTTRSLSQQSQSCAYALMPRQAIFLLPQGKQFYTAKLELQVTSTLLIYYH